MAVLNSFDELPKLCEHKAVRRMHKLGNTTRLYASVGGVNFVRALRMLL